MWVTKQHPPRAAIWLKHKNDSLSPKPSACEFRKVSTEHLKNIYQREKDQKWGLFQTNAEEMRKTILLFYKHDCNFRLCAWFFQLNRIAETETNDKQIHTWILHNWSQNTTKIQIYRYVKSRYQYSIACLNVQKRSWAFLSSTPKPLNMLQEEQVVCVMSFL